MFQSTNEDKNYIRFLYQINPFIQTFQQNPYFPTYYGYSGGAYGKSGCVGQLSLYQGGSFMGKIE